VVEDEDEEDIEEDNEEEENETNEGDESKKRKLPNNQQLIIVLPMMHVTKYIFCPLNRSKLNLLVRVCINLTINERRLKHKLHANSTPRPATVHDLSEPVQKLTPTTMRKTASH
jgi:hypothetical protein